MSKQRVTKLAEQLNVNVLSDGAGDSFYVDLHSPTGFVFVATGCHAMFMGDAPAKEVWPEILRDLRMGLETCNSECCQTEGEE